MSGRKREPTDADGPLFRAAHDRAEEISVAHTPDQKRGAWARFLPVAGAALAEVILRDFLVWVAVVFSVVAAVVGATSGDVAWAVSMVAAGIVGVALVVVALARRWSFGKQWIVVLGVIVVQCAIVLALFTLR